MFGHMVVVFPDWIGWTCIAACVLGWMSVFWRCEQWYWRRLAEMREEENEPPDPGPFKRSGGRTKVRHSRRPDDLDW